MTKLFITLAAVLVAVALLHWQVNKREAAAEAAFPPLGELIPVSGGVVHAVVHGPAAGQAPDLVMLHGSSGSTRDGTFGPLVAALARDFRVIVLDRPGHGYTSALPRGADGPADQARMLREAAIALAAEKPIISGQSFGGAVALAWGITYPQDTAALVLLAAPSQRWPGGLDPLYRVTSSRFGQWAVVPFLTAFVSDAYVKNAVAAIFDPDAVPAGYVDQVGAPLSLRRVTLRQNANQRARLKDDITQMMPKYGSLPMPIEILHGDADLTVPLTIHSEPLAAQVTTARLTVLPGVGHMPHHTASEAVAQAVARAATRAGLR